MSHLSRQQNITCVLGNIVRQTDCDAIVNAANSRLRAGSGVCGAIHAAAGPELEPFAVRLAPLDVGAVVMTPGFKLANPWIIHTVGPKYLLEHQPEKSLARAITNVISLADQHGLKRIAVPAISTGVYGYPMEEAAPQLVATARAALTDCRKLEEVRFVLSTNTAADLFAAAIAGTLAAPVITRRLIETLRDQFLLPARSIHGLAHWTRVRLNGLELARITGADPVVVELFAYFHDSCRENDGRDPWHGYRGGNLARQLQGIAFDISETQLTTLVEACHGHTGGNAPKDITIATCWDADRLDLWRIGVAPDPARLVTDAARGPEIIATAKARFDAGDGVG